MKEIDSQALEGIREALFTAKSHHVSVIDKIMAQPPSYTPSYQIGSSIYPSFEIKVSEKEGIEILDSLVKIETKYGYSKIFKERQINLLIGEWRRAIS